MVRPRRIPPTEAARRRRRRRCGEALQAARLQLAVRRDALARGSPAGSPVRAERLWLPHSPDRPNTVDTHQPVRRSSYLAVQQALARQGYTVQSSGTAAGLWKLIEAGRGDVLISDIGLPDGDALDLLPRIQQRRPDMPVIVMSARSTLLTAVKAQQTGVFEYLPKPFELRSLVEATSRAVRSAQ